MSATNRIIFDPLYVAPISEEACLSMVESGECSDMVNEVVKHLGQAIIAHLTVEFGQVVLSWASEKIVVNVPVMAGKALQKAKPSVEGTLAYFKSLFSNKSPKIPNSLLSYSGHTRTPQQLKDLILKGDLNDQEVRKFIEHAIRKGQENRQNSVFQVLRATCKKVHKVASKQFSAKAFSEGVYGAFGNCMVHLKGSLKQFSNSFLSSPIQ